MLKNKGLIASNGVLITMADLKTAIKYADVDWAKAVFANAGAASKKRIDICLFDFFNDGAWSLVDAQFVEEYEDCESSWLALRWVIESRARVWSDRAEQNGWAAVVAKRHPVYTAHWKSANHYTPPTNFSLKREAVEYAKANAYGWIDDSPLSRSYWFVEKNGEFVVGRVWDCENERWVRMSPSDAPCYW